MTGRETEPPGRRLVVALAAMVSTALAARADRSVVRELDPQASAAAGVGQQVLGDLEELLGIAVDRPEHPDLLGVEAGRRPSSRRSTKPLIEVRGVRSSWETVATTSSFIDNQLEALKEISPEAEILVFVDSDVIARNDFLTQVDSTFARSQ